MRDKLMPFLENFDDIQNTLTDKLDENDISEGSDLVVSWLSLFFLFVI